MKKLKLFTLILMLVLTVNKSHAQLEPSIKGYGPYYNLFFDSLNKLYLEELENLQESYYFYVSFKIDECAQIVNYQTIELPVIKVPDQIKNYLKRLVMFSNGKWSLKIVNGQPILPEQIVCVVSIAKKEETLKEKIESGEEVWKYLIQSPELIDQRILHVLLSQNKIYIGLEY